MNLFEEKSNIKSWFFKSIAIIMIWSFFSLQVCWANGSQLINQDLKREKVSYLAPDVAINTGDFGNVFITAMDSVKKDNSSLQKGKEKPTSEQTPEVKRNFLGKLTNGRGLMPLAAGVIARVFAAMGIGFLLTPITALGAVGVSAIIALWLLGPFVAKVLFPESAAVNRMAGITKAGFYVVGALGLYSLVVGSGGAAAALGLFMNKALLLKIFVSLSYVVVSTGFIQFLFSKGYGESGVSRKLTLLTPLLVLAASAGVAEFMNFNEIVEKESPDTAPAADKPGTDTTGSEEDSPEQIVREQLEQELENVNAEKDNIVEEIIAKGDELSLLVQELKENKALFEEYSDPTKWPSTAQFWDILDEHKPVFEYGVEIPQSDAAEFRQSMNRFAVVFDPEDIKGLEGKVNQITGKPYSTEHLANVDWDKELSSPEEVTKNMGDAFIAYQEAHNSEDAPVRTDAHYGPQTRALVNMEYLQGKIDAIKADLNPLGQELSRLQALEKEINAALEGLNKPEPAPAADQVTIGIVNWVILAGNFIASYLMSRLFNRFDKKEKLQEEKDSKDKKTLTVEKALENLRSTAADYKTAGIRDYKDVLGKLADALDAKGIPGTEEGEEVKDINNDELQGKIIYINGKRILVTEVDTEKESTVHYYKLNEAGQLEGRDSMKIEDFRKANPLHIAEFNLEEPVEETEAEKEQEEKINNLGKKKEEIREKIINDRKIVYLAGDPISSPENTFIVDEQDTNERLKGLSEMMQEAGVELVEGDEVKDEDITDELNGQFLKVDGQLVLVAAVVKGKVLYHPINEKGQFKLDKKGNKKENIEEFKKKSNKKARLAPIEATTVDKVEPKAVSEEKAPETYAAIDELRTAVNKGVRIDPYRLLIPSKLTIDEKSLNQKLNELTTVMAEKGKEISRGAKMNPENLEAGILAVIGTTPVLIMGIIESVAQVNVYYYTLKGENETVKLGEQKRKDLKVLNEQGIYEGIVTASSEVSTETHRYSNDSIEELGNQVNRLKEKESKIIKELDGLRSDLKENDRQSYLGKDAKLSDAEIFLKSKELNERIKEEEERLKDVRNELFEANFVLFRKNIENMSLDRNANLSSEAELQINQSI